MITTVLRKSTTRPWPSVRRPSSSSCSSTLKTSGWAFSISSSSSTAYGRRRTASVSWPPSSNPTYPGGAPIRRATVCFSMYSLMSRRTIARSSSNMNSASAFASSVFPTPVGPRKMNEPMGRSGSDSPARERRRALATASTASSCPTTRSCRRSSMCTSFSTSPSISLLTGMPVHDATTSATSSSDTSSFSMRCSACFSSSWRSASTNPRSSSGMVPKRSRAAPSRSASRSARSTSVRARSRSSFRSRMRVMEPFSSSHAAFIPSDCSRRSASSCATRSRRSTDAGSVSAWSACSSISSWMMRRSSTSSSSGTESISIRRRLADSSIRSIALSGRNREVM